MSKKPKGAKARKAAPTKATTEASPYRAAGFDGSFAERYISEAEAADRGTLRYPWPVAFKAKVKASFNGLKTMNEMRDTLNKMVVDALGGGLHGRGPLA